MKPILDKKYIKNAINKAQQILHKGELVIFPTETVYGIGANATNPTAIQRVYEIKNRPYNNPLICHFQNLQKIKDDFEMNEVANKLAEVFWPGPLTLILKKKKSSIILEKIINNEIQILIGTQLISKGFHFPSLNCIVVVDIDLSSQGHDLRGAEKNLQLYHQLSGRAGRTGKPATVYFQTYNLNTKMISDITNKNPDIFLTKELELRKKNNLPPYQRFISLIITSNDEKKLQKQSFEFKNYIQTKLDDLVLVPVNAPIYKIRKNFRVRLLIRGKKSLKVQNSLSLAIQNFKFAKGIKLSVDVDPINFN